MAERCVELLVLPENSSCYLLDIGCGSGLSGSVLEEMGHAWAGMDISLSMLCMLYIIYHKSLFIYNFFVTLISSLASSRRRRKRN